MDLPAVKFFWSFRLGCWCFWRTPNDIRASQETCKPENVKLTYIYLFLQTKKVNYFTTSSWLTLWLSCCFWWFHTISWEIRFFRYLLLLYNSFSYCIAIRNSVSIEKDKYFVTSLTCIPVKIPSPLQIKTSRTMLSHQHS